MWRSVMESECILSCKHDNWQFPTEDFFFAWGDIPFQKQNIFLLFLSKDMLNSTHTG